MHTLSLLFFMMREAQCLEYALALFSCLGLKEVARASASALSAGGSTENARYARTCSFSGSQCQECVCSPSAVILGRCGSAAIRFLSLEAFSMTRDGVFLHFQRNLRSGRFILLLLLFTSDPYATPAWSHRAARAEAHLRTPEARGGVAGGHAQRHRALAQQCLVHRGLGPNPPAQPQRRGVGPLQSHQHTI
jgi:hypothetical protein